MKNHQTATPTPKDLIADLRALVADAEKVIDAARAEDSDDEDPGAWRVRYDAAHERLSEIYANAKKQAAAGVKRADLAIHDNPYPSIAITAGVGVLVGMVVGVLLGRRGDK